MIFNELINVAARSLCLACEKTRRLDSVITRDAALSDGVERSDGDIAKLAETYGRYETGAVVHIESAGDALKSASSALSGNVTTGSIGLADRLLGNVSALMTRNSRLANNAVNGVSSLVGSNHQSPLSEVGAQIVSALDSAGDSFNLATTRFYSAIKPAASISVLNSANGIVSLSDIVGDFSAGLPASGGSQAHLLILTARTGQSFYFNLSTAGYDTLRRNTSYNIATQDRLTRRPALQAVSKGGENITVSGAIFTKKSGYDQLNKLRAIGYKMLPLSLTTGYGESLGEWYLSRIEEEQTALFADGMPRKQQFTLEFQRYGEDYSDI